MENGKCNWCRNKFVRLYILHCSIMSHNLFHIFLSFSSFSSFSSSSLFIAAKLYSNTSRFLILILIN